MIDIVRYVEYAHNDDNAWTKVEKPFFDYALKRFLKDRYRRLLDHPRANTLTTSSGSTIPKEFSALDLGSGTGRVAQELINFGVLPQNILGVDIDPHLLSDVHYPSSVKNICMDVVRLEENIENGFPSTKKIFNLVTANMLFHTFTYDDMRSTLSQVRKYISHEGMFLMTVPHPLIQEIDTIASYHSRICVQQATPWGGEVQHRIKTVDEYRRAFHEAGFYTPHIGTTWEGAKPDNRYLMTDDDVWEYIHRIASGGEKSSMHHLRYWIVAYPRQQKM